MSEKKITIIEFNEYDGKRSKFSEMYFETKLGAAKYISENGYEPDDILERKKDYFRSAKIYLVPLN